MKRSLALMANLTALAAATPVAAQDGGGTHCDLTATPLAFGRYSPSSGSPADFNATLTVTCISPSAEPVAVEGAITLLGGATGRRLTNGSGEMLRYQLYLDAARSRLWGDGAGGGRSVPVSGTAGSNRIFRQTVTIYGRILARQTHTMVGTYADQLEAVFDY